jgi:hypothetical protein
VNNLLDIAFTKIYKRFNFRESTSVQLLSVPLSNTTISAVLEQNLLFLNEFLFIGFFFRMDGEI